MKAWHPTAAGTTPTPTQHKNKQPNERREQKKKTIVGSCCPCVYRKKKNTSLSDPPPVFHSPKNWGWISSRADLVRALGTKKSASALGRSPCSTSIPLPHGQRGAQKVLPVQGLTCACGCPRTPRPEIMSAFRPERPQFMRLKGF